jgi:hypothetical protein
VEKVLWEMKVKRWQQKAVNREEWLSMIRRSRLTEGHRAEE